MLLISASECETDGRLALVSRESVLGGQTSTTEQKFPGTPSKAVGLPPAKRSKIAIESAEPQLNASHDSGWVSASGASVLTCRDNQKTMVQTTDAEADEVGMQRQSIRVSKANLENAGISSKRQSKAQDKQKLKISQQNSDSKSNCDEPGTTRRRSGRSTTQKNPAGPKTVSGFSDAAVV